MIYLGALATGLWWKIGADRTRDAGFAAKVHRRLRTMDGEIVGPAAIVVFSTGYGMIRFFGGRIAEHMFVLFGLIFLFLALALWYMGMRRLGDRLADEAESAAGRGEELGRDYGRLSAAWVACAGGAVFFVVLAAVFMIFRLPSA
jgi:uncharacterized membrane protein